MTVLIFKILVLHSESHNTMTVTPICKVPILRLREAKKLSLNELEKYVSWFMPYWGDRRFNPSDRPVHERIERYYETREHRSNFDNKKELLSAIYSPSLVKIDINGFMPY